MQTKIMQITANWRPVHHTVDDSGGACDTYEPELNGCIKIIEHVPQGEGDKWFYDVYFGNSRIKRIFNIDTVSYEVL